MDQKKKIGIFEYDRLMDSFIKDLAVMFAENEYEVDIFYKDSDNRTNITDIFEFDNFKGIRFFNFTVKSSITQKIIRKFRRLFNNITLRFSFHLSSNENNIIDKKIIEETKKITGSSQYYCLIGVEKKGLIWAGIISKEIYCPLIYYSLELYIENHPQFDMFCHLRKTEKEFHKLCAATIIQDKARSEVLLNANEISSGKLLFFPVSVRGDVIYEKSDYLYNKLKIDKSKKIILYFGTLYSTRFIDHIVKMADEINDDMVIVLHGFGFGIRNTNRLKYLQSIANKSKVFFSFELVPEDEIVKLISSAHIGFALYDSSNPNDSLIALSSAKIAYYSKCGVPIIVIDTSSVKALLDEFHFGEAINSISEIPNKIDLIFENYDNYRKQAFNAFQKYYNFDKNFNKFLPHLNDIIP